MDTYRKVTHVCLLCVTQEEKLSSLGRRSLSEKTSKVTLMQEEEAEVSSFCTHWPVLHIVVTYSETLLPRPQEDTFEAHQRKACESVTEVPDKAMAMSTVYIHCKLHLLSTGGTYKKEVWHSPIQSLALSTAGPLRNG